MGVLGCASPTRWTEALEALQASTEGTIEEEKRNRLAKSIGVRGNFVRIWAGGEKCRRNSKLRHRRVCKLTQTFAEIGSPHE